MAGRKRGPWSKHWDVNQHIIYIYTGWWFGTFFIFHNIWDNPSNWLIFFRGVETTNQDIILVFFEIFGQSCAWAVEKASGFWPISWLIGRWNPRQVDRWDNQIITNQISDYLTGLLPGLFTAWSLFVLRTGFWANPFVISQYSAAMPSHRPLAVCLFKMQSDVTMSLVQRIWQIVSSNCAAWCHGFGNHSGW